MQQSKSLSFFKEVLLSVVKNVGREAPVGQFFKLFSLNITGCSTQLDHL